MDEDNLEVLDEDVDGTNDNEEEDGSKKTKEVIPKYLSFGKGFVDSDDVIPLLTLKFNRETVQDSNIIKVTSKKLLRKAIEMLRKLAKNNESNEEKESDIDDETKEVEINENGEVVETENDELVVDAANNAPPPQESPTTTTATAAAAEEGGHDNAVGTKDGGDNNTDNTKGG